MRIVLAILISVTLFSCMTPNKIASSLVGKSEFDIVNAKGLPDRKGDDGAGGEVFVYSETMRSMYESWYRYWYFYFDKTKHCYHVRWEDQPMPVQQMNIRVIPQPQNRIYSGYN